MNPFWTVAIIVWVGALITLLLGERLNTLNRKIDRVAGLGVRSRRMNPKLVAATLGVMGAVFAVLAIRS